MEGQFWHNKWRNNEIGFHQAGVNPHLLRSWDELSIVPAAQVFVPMCGKSRDMLWLRDQGYSVVGIELSKMAVEAFFAENNLPVTVTNRGDLCCYRADNVTIYCGDFFDLTVEHLKNVRAVYDRASLVALPPEMREQYVQHSLNILPARIKMLLVTMEYDQQAMAGPPFSVTEEEVKRHYEARFSIQSLHAAEILEENPIFIERGLQRLQEKSYVLG